MAVIMGGRQKEFDTVLLIPFPVSRPSDSESIPFLIDHRPVLIITLQDF